jgi:hypothetical protein
MKYAPHKFLTEQSGCHAVTFCCPDGDPSSTRLSQSLTQRNPHHHSLLCQAPALARSLPIQRRALLGSRAPEHAEGAALEGRRAGGWWRSNVRAGAATLVEGKAKQVGMGLPTQQVDVPLLAPRTSRKWRQPFCPLHLTEPKAIVSGQRSSKSGAGK